mgnify:FL=1
MRIRLSLALAVLLSVFALQGWSLAQQYRVVTQATLPAACVVGEYVQLSDGTSHRCTSTNTWTAFSSGSGAPTGATYLTQTAHADLTAEQAMGALTTGLVVNATTTGVQSIYGGTSCTNQFPRSLDASGAATCASVANADLAGSIAASKLVGTDIATVGTITS